MAARQLEPEVQRVYPSDWSARARLWRSHLERSPGCGCTCGLGSIEIEFGSRTGLCGEEERSKLCGHGVFGKAHGA